VFPTEAGIDDASAPDVVNLPNHALHFDGVGDFATSGTAGFPTGSSPQTISLWVRYPPLGDAGNLTQAFVVLRRDAASGIALGFRNGALAAWTIYGTKTLVQAPTLPAAGVWHHVALVLSPNDAGSEAVTLYVDGVVSASASAAPNELTPVSCWIGTLDGMTYLYAGDMDEIRVWVVARTQAQIVEEMNGEIPGPQPGLVALFDGDGIDGARLPDKSGNGNDATLGGGDPSRMPQQIPAGPGLSPAAAP
jgi:hypothetical protein